MLFWRSLFQEFSMSILNSTRRATEQVTTVQAEQLATQPAGTELAGRNMLEANRISVLSSRPYRRFHLFVISVIVSGVILLVVAIVMGTRGIPETSQEKERRTTSNMTMVTRTSIKLTTTARSKTDVFSWSEWSSWLPYNATCGYKQRMRKCRSLYTKHHGTSCYGPMMQKRNLHPCRDCKDWYLSGGSQISGVYTIQPDSLHPFHVYCDMTTDGGGWTVFQRRQDGSQDFYRTWDDYKTGFGNLSGEFWLGNDKIHRLTAARETRLRVDLEDWNGNKKYTKYRKFNVSRGGLNYALNVKGYSGSAGDSLARAHNGMVFTTKDKDNDNHPSNCAVLMSGAWWYNNCHDSNLNGLYVRESVYNWTAVTWYDFHENFLALKFSEMKLRAS